MKFTAALLLVTLLPAPAFSDDLTFVTTNQASGTFASAFIANVIAQRFTTDNSEVLTLRRIDFTLTEFNTFFGQSQSLLKIEIFSDRANLVSELDPWMGQATPIGVLSANVYSAGPYSAFGQVDLQPNTTYWARFMVPAFITSGSLQIPLSAPGTGSGRWFGAGDDVSALWIADAPNNFGGYKPALQIVMSTVPEPAVSALLFIAVFVKLAGCRKKELPVKRHM